MKYQPICRGKNYPLTVQIIDAPEKPEHLIAFTYLECIENRNYVDLNDVSDKDATDITNWVLKGGHTPSLECVHLTFTIRNISRILSHQIVRHRIGVSIGQRTQRANAEEYLGKFYDNEHFVLPPSIQNMEDNEYLFNYLKTAQEIYNLLINNGISQDDARYIIPHCAETSMTLTISYKSLMHVCSTRLCHVMQGEMVELAQALKRSTYFWNEFLGKYLKPVCGITGKCNRNENNPTQAYPKGVCLYTQNGEVAVREKDDTFDLTKYSKDATK